jgi:hypothetical protein
MPSALGTVREDIEAQGFCGLDDSTCRQINYPLRLSPAICMLWAVQCEVTGPHQERIVTDMPAAMGGAASGPNPGWLLRGSALCA